MKDPTRKPQDPARPARSNWKEIVTEHPTDVLDTLGADAPPACYDDLNQAATLFIAGTKTTDAGIQALRKAMPGVEVKR